MNYFIFNNKSSLEFQDIIINQLPSISSAAERIYKKEVPGRSGFLYKQTGSFDILNKTVKCTLKSTDNIDNIKSWLSGSGKVIFSNEPDRFYKSIIINKIDFEYIFRNFKEFMIPLECDPFGYLTTGENTITISNNNTVIYNGGNYYSEPYMKIYGTGTIQVTVGDIEFSIDNVSEYVELDVEIPRCYKGTQNKGNDKVGKWPILVPGKNNISWIGNISKIEIIPRWRCR